MAALCYPRRSVVSKLASFPLISLSGIFLVAAENSSVCDGLEERTVDIFVTEKFGGAYEYKKIGVTYAGSMGEVYVGHVTWHRGNVLSALRFTGVHVPKRALVSAARVHLVDAHVGTECCQGSDLTVLLQMEHAAHSTPLPGHDVDGWLLSSLALTAALPWRPPVTETYNVTSTPDLRELLQIVVSMEGWVPGNAVTLLLNSEGAEAEVDERVYFGSGGFAEQQAKLEITFCEPQPPADSEATTTTCLPTPACPACPSRSNGTAEDMVLMENMLPAPADPKRSIKAGVVVVGLCCLIGMVTRTMTRRRQFSGSTEEASQLCTVTPEQD